MSTEPVAAHKSNPLSKFFRTPAIYLSLPSGGKFWPKQALDMPENGELPVFPMTQRDEITLRTPDALINGQGVVDVIQSCIPNIKNAWLMPSTDVDSCLIAMRIASYGHNMDFDQVCPHCREEHTYGMDLRHAMESIRAPDYGSVKTFDGLNIRFKPQNYKQANHMSQVGFQMQRTQQAIEQLPPESEEQMLAVNQQLNKLTELTAEVMANCTEYIELADTGEKITDHQYLQEFYNNIDSKLFKNIQDTLASVTEPANMKASKTACQSCGETIELNIMFDYASFFGLGS